MKAVLSKRVWKKNIQINKICACCGREYIAGHKKSFRCPDCRYTQCYRDTKRPVNKYAGSNQVLSDLVQWAGPATLFCKLCGEPFQVIARPSRHVYPKFCEAHRNEYRRGLWKKVSIT